MEKKVEEFIKDPKKALYKLAMPIVIAMIVQTMYNIIDTAFIGRLGASAIAGLTFSFPLFFILIAFNSGIGAGANSRIARFLGAKNKKDAENAAMHAIILSLISSVLIYALGMPNLEYLFVLFGAEGTVLKYAMDYMSIILIGSFFMFPAYILSNIFSAQGDTKTPMKINISALILNAILDPIFIYTFKLGIKGAAIATVISFLFSLILGIYYIKRKSYLYIHKSSFKFSLEILKDIIKVGAPASLMMIFMSIYVIFLNLFMIKFGTNYVAAFGIATRLESVAMMPVVAFSLSTMTLIGMFYGAKRYDLVKNITWYSIKICLTIASSVGLIFLIFPSLFIKIFTAETALISIGSAYLRIDVFTFPLMAFSILVSKAMQGMGYGLPGLVINLIRVFIVSVPLAYLFVNILNYGFLSIAVAMVIGGLSSVIVGFIWLESKFLKLKKKKTNLSN